VLNVSAVDIWSNAGATRKPDEPKIWNAMPGCSNVRVEGKDHRLDAAHANQTCFGAELKGTYD